MAKQEKYYSYALIAIVAIVAIVGIVVMMLNAQPKLGISTSTEQESLLGAAATIACTDSDGGKNYGLQGTATKGTNKVTDYCLADGKRVVEYYCSNGKINSVTYDCNKVGKVCRNGACIKLPVCGNGIIEAGEECDDGNNLNGDGCDANCRLEIIPCTDSDGGIYPLVKGTAISGSYSQTDYCSNSNYLIENYCSAGGISATTVDCAYSYNGTCVDGACVQTVPCTDSDGGKSYYVRGLIQGMTPAGYFTNSTDYCVDSSILEEYYCYNNLVYDYRYTCPYGCNNGVCTSAQIRETDTCIFGGSYNWTNYCYSDKGNCTGYSSCSAGVIGASGERVTWASNCIGNPTTTIDGVNENISFNCTIH
jgi:cysteine-rich repeat protein